MGRIHNVPLEEIYAVTQGDMAGFTSEEEEMDIEKLRELSPALDALFKKYPKNISINNKLNFTIIFANSIDNYVLNINSLCDKCNEFLLTYPLPAVRKN